MPQILNLTLNARDQVHAAGIQTGLPYVPKTIALTARYQWEFGTERRFEGENFILTFVKGF